MSSCIQKEEASISRGFFYFYTVVVAWPLLTKAKGGLPTFT